MNPQSDRIREVALYLVFGVLTTLVGFGTYFSILFAATAFGINEESGEFYAVRGVAQVVQWILAVLVAYYTNKKWVFRHAPDKTGGERAGRFLGFVGARLFSLGADTAVTFGTVAILSAGGYRTREILGFPLSADGIAKILAAVVVIVLNYLLSKFLVFRDKKKTDNLTGG